MGGAVRGESRLLRTASGTPDALGSIHEPGSVLGGLPWIRNWKMLPDLFHRVWKRYDQPN